MKGTQVKKLFFLIMIFSSVFAQTKLTNIAVLDLDPTGIDEEQSRFLSDRLRAELFNTGSFNVVERDKMNTILQEQGFQQSGCTSIECAVEIGQLLNVQEMVAGTLGKIDNIYSINLRLIDVEKGTIIQTATRDYKGILSDVLTKIIPAVANELAGTSKIVNEMQQAAEPEPVLNSYNWSVQLKFGTAALNYIQEYNDAIKEYNDNHALINFDDYPASTNAGIEIYYRVSPVWRYHAGINFIRQTGVWQFKMDDFTLGGVQFEKLEIDRQYEFSHIFIGADYIKAISDRFDLIIGADAGIIGLNSKIEQRYRTLAGEKQDSDDTFNYTAATLKLRIGFDYRLADHFVLFLYAEPLLTAKLKTEEQPSTSLFNDFNSVIYPDEINASGALLSLGVGYLF